MFLALREIRRSPWRYVLFAAAVGLLVFLILFQQALRDGLITQFIGAIRNQSAPVLVYGEQARKNLEGSQIPPPAEAAVTGVEGVAGSGRLGEGTFTVSTEVSRAEEAPNDRLVDAVLFGYELGGLGAPTTLTEGRLPEADDEGVASSRNADEGFDIGDRVRLEPDGFEITVVGLARDTNFSVSPTLFVSYPTYERARLIRNPDATAVLPSAVLLAPDDGLSPADLVERVNAEVEGVEALTRAQAESEAPGVSAVNQSLDTVIRLLQFTVLLVVGLFLLILTVQKQSSLTLLRAIGASGWKLAAAVLIQAVLVVSAGSLLGIGAYALATLGTRDIGITFTADVIPGAVIGVLVAALVGSLAALWRVRQIDPIDATRTTGAL